jgi:hypothetical protein
MFLSFPINNFSEFLPRIAAPEPQHPLQTIRYIAEFLRRGSTIVAGNTRKAAPHQRHRPQKIVNLSNVMPTA